MGILEGKVLKVKVTFTEEVLGTASNNPEIHEEFIASKAPDVKSLEEEVAAVGTEEVFEKGMTVFPRDKEGRPIAWDYQWKGFFKDACGMLRKVSGSECSKIKAYKKEIDGLIFPEPRAIPFELGNQKMAICQRPLRGQTAQGERVALASSESIPAGATMTFDIRMLAVHKNAVLEMLDYGRLRGFGQWRNSGKGRFTYEILEER